VNIYFQVLVRNRSQPKAMYWSSICTGILKNCENRISLATSGRDLKPGHPEHTLQVLHISTTITSTTLSRQRYVNYLPQYRSNQWIDVSQNEINTRNICVDSQYQILPKSF